MAAKKRKGSASWDIPFWLSRFVHLLTGSAFALGLLITVVFVAVCAVLWNAYGDDLLRSDQYRVTAASLEITPLPEWIRSDPRPWVADYVNLKGPLSIMDNDAVERVADAFKLHPWIEEVTRITKHHPARVRVELRYRAPVCRVYCVIKGKEELCPVDVRGVWLPAEDFEPGDEANYPVVVGIQSMPASLPGLPWRDDSVVGAAEIAAAFGRSWRELGLHRLVVAGRTASDSQARCVYSLYTWRGTAGIVWGRPPGKYTDEPSAKDKVALLHRYVATYGSLDAALEKGPIDLRSPIAPGAADRVATE